MKTVRISGLVRAVDQVRRQLAASPSPAQLARTLSMVARTLSDVDAILVTQRAKVKNLPAPSQRAYRFLSDLRRNPPSPAAAPADALPVPVIQHTWRGLRPILERNLDRLARAHNDLEIGKTHTSIAAASGQIEGDIQRRQIAPDHLSRESRDIRGWLAFLADRENVLAYLAARDLAASVLDAPARQTGRWRMPLLIHFRPIHHIYRLRQVRDASILSLPTPMLAFDRAGFEALAQRIFGKNPQAKHALHQQMISEPYQNLHAQIESLAGLVERAVGAFHDLNDSFARVNNQYFAGQMQKPHLTWSRVLTGRKFGHHDPIRDTVLLSSTLDRPDVPAFVVDFVMYHELLHKQLGLRWTNGRRYAHTPEFMSAERRFARYAEAEDWLARLSREVNR